jgi:hypothetical protein
MEVELGLPQTPVRLAPGGETRAPLQVRNLSTAPIGLRIAIARGRASDWARPEPADVTVAGGDTATVELVFRPPAEQPTSAALVPFAVRADDLASGETAGWASGLFTVAAPDPVTAELTPAAETPDQFGLRLRSNAADTRSVRINVTLEPPKGGVEATPGAVQLAAGGDASAVIWARPRRPLLGLPKAYTVVVELHDEALAADEPPLATVTSKGARRPLLSSRAATALAIAVVVLATAAVAVFGGGLGPLTRKNAATPKSSAAPAVVTVRRPYVVADVFPHLGADGGRGAAEAAQGKLTAAGMQLRLVDSLSSDVLPDDAAGFWVLLQDGFADDGQAQAYCDKYRTVAPKCRPGS